MTADERELISDLSDGNPGAINVLCAALSGNPLGYAVLLGVKTMNLRGSQIWRAYKEVCGSDIGEFANRAVMLDPTLQETTK